LRGGNPARRTEHDDRALGQPQPARGRAKKQRSTTARNVRRSLKIIAFLFVFNFFVLPAVGGVRNAIDQLLQLDPWFLVLGVGLQLLALLAYAQLMRVSLPHCDLGLFRMLRINLATKSLTNVVPGGSAAGSALSYRLLVTSSVDPPDAGFAVAACGVVSAVVLNLILWVALLLSLPFHGVNALYGFAAIAGVLVMALAAALVYGLLRGRERANRALRAITSRLRFIDPERATAVVEQVADRLGEIIRDRELVVRAGVWASLNWLLDALSLWVFIRAYGQTTNLIGLLVAFGLANVLAVIPITPGGLGIIEGVLVPTLVGFGVGGTAAGLGVATYRLASFWLPIPLGGIAYLTVRRDLRPVRLRDAAVEAYGSGETGIDWAERYGHRRPAEYT
jgi:uncharacterized protein (TIRG00374 family)